MHSTQYTPLHPCYYSKLGSIVRDYMSQIPHYSSDIEYNVSMWLLTLKQARLLELYGPPKLNTSHHQINMDIPLINNNHSLNTSIVFLSEFIDLVSYSLN